ncbi:coniferyl aldehyde dehydrogenase [Vibrio sp. ZSDZ34]|uniref:Aldehyde dehydrogenase n=1 Tax=Vibrio gelatinilyticus TaxID=2893468 RepID=A0A9X1WC69_9VIBR|nr:coniferyl aldehyde dehydrogenase [Vibrio gelatinilyticus]MCJ2378187.1 coniferyl aldehyde dehydrogenase [Vibrio gelatinilyticus]
MNLNERFQQTQDAFQEDTNPTLEQRVDRIQKLKRILLGNIDVFAANIAKDFGQRSLQDTMLEILPIVNNIHYTLENLEQWMQPSVRNPGVLLASTSEASVTYQPKGVVGIISTWNAPLMVTINPLTTALAAGNRALIKMSEFTPNLNAALKTALATEFDETEVCIIEGEADIAAQFSALPFDHILFTGSTTVGRLVMKAAADNLTPVTLELGGKSPVLIDDTISISKAVERIVVGKSANNGQYCIAPDYVLIPDNKLEEFIDEYTVQYQQLFSEGVDSPEMTSLATEGQLTRLHSYLEEAQNKAERIVSCHPNGYRFEDRLISTQLIINPAAESLVMTNEIFGPLLPVVTYQTFDEALQIIESNPNPLALYLMSESEERQLWVTKHVRSGGMCINDALFHASVDDAPFGGVRESGIGAYHGIEGFHTFSHVKTVLKTGNHTLVKQMFVPGDNEVKQMIAQLLNG